jgi:hypothetical protein
MRDFVTKVMRDPRVWEWVRIDGVRKEHFCFSDQAIYFANDYGFVMFRQAYPTTSEVHVCMLKGAKNVDEFVKDSLEKMRQSGVKKFIAPIGEWNRPALKLASRCGFVKEGHISNVWHRDGKPQSLIIMGGL